MRAWLRLTPLVLAGLGLALVQMLALRLKPAAAGKIAGKIPCLFHRLGCGLLDVRVHVKGTPAQGSVLLVSNHVSWLDIPVLGSIMPLSFIAKSEVARWPVFGTLARLQRSVFVERKRRHATGQTVSEIASRLDSGERMVLFAEGTSGDGGRVLPLRSALLGAVCGETPTQVQPVAIAWSRVQGVPMGRALRPTVAWIGDQDLLPHLLEIVRTGGLDVEVCFGAVRTATPHTDRKQMARDLEADIRSDLNAALHRHGGI